MVRFVFRDMVFNHGISCEVCNGKKCASRRKALKFANDLLFSTSKDAKLTL